MDQLSIKKYRSSITNAIRQFWNTRTNQLKGQKKEVQGSRGAVAGGKQLDGFVQLLKNVAVDIGVPEECIYTQGNTLPGYFRPTKNWDFLIISPQKHLVAVAEFKSQVGSFGNNFNNRVEEAVGSAVDLWTAFRENGFPQNQPPWLGYLIVVERAPESESVVSVKEPHHKVRPEFHDTNYLKRYALFCQKMMIERHYTQTAMIWTNKSMDYGNSDEEISIDRFLLSFMGFLLGKVKEFEQ